MKYLDYIRENLSEYLNDVQKEVGRNNKEAIIKAANQRISEIVSIQENIITRSQASEATKISERLLLEYAASIARLESRNDFWNYEYMSFSRRVGELWEKMMKIPFTFSQEVTPIVPPLFADVRKSMNDELVEYISRLSITQGQKAELLHFYEKVWKFVNSSEISLTLDTHCSKGGYNYNIDFKSGFHSNEKGNTNRLLMVATIYHEMQTKEECCLIVRSKDSDDNHYFRTLQDSGVWRAYCGEEAYNFVSDLTGFNVLEWLRENINWERDLRSDFLSYLQQNELIKYLNW